MRWKPDTCECDIVLEDDWSRALDHVNLPDGTRLETQPCVIHAGVPLEDLLEVVRAHNRLGR